MTLLDQIRRAADAKRPGGLGLRGRLALSTALPSTEELADKVREIDPEATEAEALEFAHHAREAALNVLEMLLTDVKEER